MHATTRLLPLLPTSDSYNEVSADERAEARGVSVGSARSIGGGGGAPRAAIPTAALLSHTVMGPSLIYTFRYVCLYE